LSQGIAARKMIGASNAAAPTHFLPRVVPGGCELVSMRSTFLSIVDRPTIGLNKRTGHNELQSCRNDKSALHILVAIATSPLILSEGEVASDGSRGVPIVSPESSGF